MAGRRSKKFISIGRKIITDVTFFMFLFVAAFSMYIYSSMKENAMVFVLFDKRSDKLV